MAGDWIKFETATLEKPEVCQIADAADIDLDAAVGKLLRVWVWFDQQSEDGNAPSVSKKLLDRLVGVTGFCGLMESVGWMTNVDGVISLPNFERHNGKTAKNRALTAKRVANHKVKTNADGNGAGVSGALPREEKRREDQEHKNKPPPKTRRPKFAIEEINLPAWMPKQEWADYVEMRRVKKKPVTPSIAARVIKKLESMALAGHNISAALEASIVNCWTDIYEPKVDFNGSGTNTGTRGASRPSLVDRVIQANAHLFEEDRAPLVDERDWPEFNSIREIDGHLVGPDD